MIRQLHDGRRSAACRGRAGITGGRNRTHGIHRARAALRWERIDGTFFATVSAILNIIALLGVVIAVRGCDTCVARFLGKTL